MPKFPSFQFYPGDWMKDPKLGLCSPATRGIWIDCLCAMHESDPRGIIEGSADQLARLLRASSSDVQSAVDELLATGAATVTLRNGKITLTNRRMVKEAKEREANRLRQDRHRKKRNSNENVTLHSSSSSSSSSSNPVTSLPEKRKRGSPKRAFPDDFEIKESMKEWAAKSAPLVDLEKETEKFRDYWLANGGAKKDWEAAWRTWIGNARDWNVASRRPQPAATLDTSWVLNTETVHGKCSK